MIKLKKVKKKNYVVKWLEVNNKNFDNKNRILVII